MASGIEGEVRMGRPDNSGYHRAGTVFYSFPSIQGGCQRVAVFFPGDNAESVFSPFVDELSNPKCISDIIARKLPPGTATVVVYPSHYSGPFACYSNLFCGPHQRLTASGEPLGFSAQGLPTTHAVLQHLDASWRTFLEAAPAELSTRPAEQVDEVILLGFSKGGVVLQQLISEMAMLATTGATSAEPHSGASDRYIECRHQAGREPGVPCSGHWPFSTCESFLRRVSTIHFLDVGLNCRGAYPTDGAVVSNFLSFVKRNRLTIQKGSKGPFRMLLHGTPRQWRDKRRRWIGQEKDTFVELLRDREALVRKWAFLLQSDAGTGAQWPKLLSNDTFSGHLASLDESIWSEASADVVVDEIEYFGGERPSVEMHFAVIGAMALPGFEFRAQST